MIRAHYSLGVLACFATIALVLLTRTGEPMRPGYAPVTSSADSAFAEGALVGAFALGDLAALPTPNGP